MPTINDYLNDPLNDIATQEEIIRALSPKRKKALPKVRLTNRGRRLEGKRPPPKKNFKPGVMATAVALMLKAGSNGFTRSEVVDELHRIFPKRKRSGLETTVYLLSLGNLPNGHRMRVIEKPDGRLVVLPKSVPESFGKRPAAEV